MRRLATCSGACGANAVFRRRNSLESMELDQSQVYDAVESIHLLHADLPQLRADLEHELRRLIQRLLAAM